MEVFARRAAPVQAHYLGYPGSTGLTEMDYWIGDKILTPLNIQNYFSEKLWQLPRVWLSYLVNSMAPAIKWKPADDGVICIGSFNSLAKLTESSIELWSKILDAMPKSYLLLNTKRLNDAGNRRRVLEQFYSYGIAKERIKLKFPTPESNSHFLEAYDELDIALDPYGAASGGTTTCDALLMGVPVITLVKSDSPVGARISSAILHAVGHPEWITNCEQDYINKVVELANDVHRRKLLRYEQRKKMLQSSLCDSKDLARVLEDAYENMFNNWYHSQTQP
jgi:predicted O-linked N-acetylglucosamine transferase (SPINDLY family)